MTYPNAVYLMLKWFVENLGPIGLVIALALGAICLLISVLIALAVALLVGALLEEGVEEVWKGNRWLGVLTALVALWVAVVVMALEGAIFVWLAILTPGWAWLLAFVVNGTAALANILTEPLTWLWRRWRPWPRTGVVTSNMLNVRGAPDPDADIVHRLNRGEQVQGIGQDASGWLQIGEDEWVSARYVQLS